MQSHSERMWKDSNSVITFQGQLPLRNANSKSLGKPWLFQWGHEAHFQIHRKIRCLFRTCKKLISTPKSRMWQASTVKAVKDWLQLYPCAILRSCALMDKIHFNQFWLILRSRKACITIQQQNYQRILYMSFCKVSRVPTSVNRSDTSRGTRGLLTLATAWPLVSWMYGGLDNKFRPKRTKSTSVSFKTKFCSWKILASYVSNLKLMVFYDESRFAPAIRTQGVMLKIALLTLVVDQRMKIFP